MLKNPKKLTKTVNIEEQIGNLLKDLTKFNEIFRKSVIYDNIKSHKKQRLYPLHDKFIFGKSTGGSPSSLFRVNKSILWKGKMAGNIWNNTALET